MDKMIYDVLIIGAGPTGLFAAYKLAGHCKVLVIDKGRDIEKRICRNYEHNGCLRCDPCNITSGVGGSGLFSDGKLNFDYRIGSNLEEIIGRERAIQLTKEVEDIFAGYSITAEELDKEKCRRYEIDAYKAGVRFLSLRQAHVGSDKLPEIIKRFRDGIKDKGVKINCEEEFLSTDGCKAKTNKGEYVFGKIVLGLGRLGARILETLCKKNKLAYHYQSIDIGLRIEVPSQVMDEICSVIWDPKIYVPVKNNQEVRTFCVCPNGYVVREDEENYCLVNGHSYKDKKSENTNFAFLLSKKLTEPIRNTNAFGRMIAEGATHVGGGRPILQSLGDFIEGKRSTWEKINGLKHYIEPTLKDVTPGSIGLALPYDIIEPLREGIEKIDRFLPGIMATHTLLYAVEEKLHGLRVETNESLETSCRNIYVGGDAPGISRGIVGAASCGLLIAEEILK